MKRFTDYHQAYDAAVTMAREYNHSVLIRKVKEYGKVGFNLSFATPFENGELVTPQHPRTQEAS